MANTPPDNESIARYVTAQEEQNRIQAEALEAMKNLGAETKNAVEKMIECHQEQAQWNRETRTALCKSEELGMKPGESLGLLIQAQAITQGNVDKTLSLLSDKMGMPGEKMQDIENALSVQNPGAGGINVPVSFFDEIIPFFRETPTIFGLGVRTIPLGAAGTDIPRLLSGTAASWGTENAEIALSAEPVWGMLELRPKELQIRMRMSNKFMEFAGSAAQMVAMDAAAAYTQEWARAAMNGEGGKKPVGLFSSIYGTQLPRYAGAMTVESRTYWSQFKKTFRKANKGQIVSGLSWVWNEDVTAVLEGAENGLSMPRYPELEKGKIMGIPFVEDFQLTTTDDTHDVSQIVLGAWNEFFVAMSRQQRLVYSTHSRIAYGQTEMFLTGEGDCGPRQLNGFCLSETGWLT